jgi:hypothetical protein
MTLRDSRLRMAGSALLALALLLSTGLTAADAGQAAPAPKTVFQGSGTIEGGFAWKRHRDATVGRARLVQDDTLTVRAALDFAFSVDVQGDVTGKGTGQYTSAKWDFTGSRGGAAFSCSAPVTTKPFTVSLRGSMRAKTVSVRLTLEGATETTATTDCGSGFVVPGETSTRLASSLAQVIGRGGVDLDSANRTLEIDSDLANSRYDPFSVHHEWVLSAKTPDCPASFDAASARRYEQAQEKLKRALTLLNSASATYAGAASTTNAHLSALAADLQALDRGTVKALGTRGEIARDWPRLSVLPSLTKYARAVGGASDAWRAADRRLVQSLAAARSAAVYRVACEPNFRRAAFFASFRTKSIAEKRSSMSSLSDRSLSMQRSVTPLRNVADAVAAARRMLPNDVSSVKRHVSRALAEGSRAMALQTKPAKAVNRARATLADVIRA